MVVLVDFCIENNEKNNIYYPCTECVQFQWYFNVKIGKIDFNLFVLLVIYFKCAFV